MHIYPTIKLYMFELACHLFVIIDNHKMCFYVFLKGALISPINFLCDNSNPGGPVDNSSMRGIPVAIECLNATPVCLIHRDSCMSKNDSTGLIHPYSSINTDYITIVFKDFNYNIFIQNIY